MKDECYSVLKSLPDDHVSSSMQIARTLLDCSKELFIAGDADRLRELIERVILRQSSMAAVLNAAVGVLRAIEEGKIDYITQARALFENGEKRALEIAIRHLKGVKSVATYSFSSTVERLLYALMPERVYLSVAHPAREGEALAKKLKKSNIEPVLFEDSAYSLVLRDVEAVIVGADAVFDDAFVNKTGTLNLALLARHFGKPFYVVGCLCKYLDDKSRKLFKIRPMHPEEVSDLGCERLNYYFEEIPLALISAFFGG